MFFKIDGIISLNFNFQMDVVKILTCGDPHIKPDNFREIELLISKMEKLVVEEDPDLVVILGDMLHTHDRINMDCFVLVEKFLKKMHDCSRGVVFIIGNHDRFNNEDFLTNRHVFNPFKKWPKMTIVDDVTILKIRDTEFLFVPYVPNGKFMEALNTKDVNLTNITAVFGHSEFEGCSIQKLTGSKCDKWEKDYPVAIMGHLHNEEIPQENLIYTGTPFQHGAGDTTEKTVSIFKFKDGEYSRKKIFLDIPSKYLIHLTPSELSSYTFPPNCSFVKIKVKGNSKEIDSVMKMDNVKELLNCGKVKIVPIYTDSKLRTTSTIVKKRISFSQRMKDFINSENDNVRNIFGQLF